MQTGQASATTPSPRLVLAALVAVQILFGVNYVITKVVVDVFPPLVWASIRIVIASVVMVSVALATGRKHPTDGKKFFGPLVIFALLGIIINQSSFLVGLRHTTATNSAVLNTLIPVFTLLIVTFRGQEPLTLKRALGFACALTGVLAIRKLEDLNFSNSTWFGDLLTVVNCLSYAFFLSFSKKFLEQHDRIWTTAWLFMYGSIGLSLLALPDWMAFHWPPMDTRLLACMVFAVLGGTLLTYFLNFWALAHARSSSVALFIYVQPIVASLLAWTWMGQEPTPRTFVSSGLIFVGMLLGLSSNKAAPLPKIADRADAVTPGAHVTENTQGR
jgi:drug/metabolite transporter (DMT)-like permease